MRFTLYVALGIHLMSMPIQSAVQQQNPEPFVISIRAVNSTVHVGEAFELRISLKNLSSHEIFTSSTYQTSGFNYSYTYDVRTSSGEAARKKMRPKDAPIVGSGSQNTIKPGETLEESCVVSAEFDFSTPGKYAVQLSRSIPDGQTHLLIKSNRITLTVVP